jgi:drug/metabolite transporter (DMT)-like permease
VSVTSIDNKQAVRGTVAMMMTAFLWSLAGLFIKIVDWHPFAIAGTRSLIASVVVLAAIRRPRFHFSFPQVAAAVANAVKMLLFVAANKTTTAANAILLQYTAPVFTALIAAALLKEKVHWEQGAAIVLVSAGMAIMFFDRLDAGKLPGNILAVLSGLTFSFYFVFMRMQKDGSPFESALMSHWITAAFCLVVSIFLPLPAFSAASVLSVAVLGIFQVGLSAVLFSVAIKRIPAVSANLIAVIEPVFNPLWVFLVLGEAPALNTLIGGGIIIAAVACASAVAARRARA